MNLLMIAGTSFVIGLSGALSPGPFLAVTIDQSLKKGFKAGPLMIAGHAILELALIILLVQGLGRFLIKPAVFAVLSVAGGLLLVWMGQDMLRKSGIMGMDSNQAHKSSNATVWSGIIVSLSNPYWSIWWATLGLTWLAIALPRGIPGVAAFFAGHISADFLWYSLVSYSVSRGRQKITPKIYRLIISVCGVFLVGFGIWLIGKLFTARAM